jgi:hypothetical protein
MRNQVLTGQSWPEEKGMAGGEDKETMNVIRDPVLATACHEAAPAVASIMLGIPFLYAEVGCDADRGGGRVVVDGKPDPATEEGMVSAMAGAAFDALLRPHAPLVSIFSRSCRCGFCVATWQPASICFGDVGWRGRKKVMPAFLRSKGLVQANSDTIVKVGRVLAQRGRMTGDEILEVATDPQAACFPGRRSQAGTGTIAGKIKMLKPEEDVALRHWGTCLHEAAHAVMHTRDGHGVSLADIAVWSSDVGGRGEVVYVGDEPLLSSLVAGYLAQRLWGLSDYYQSGRMRIRATGDFHSLPRLESRKRAGEKVTMEDRKAAMRVWQAEYRKLKSRILRDPTFELQIKAVARALSLHGMLDGDEVRRAMDEALGACGSPEAGRMRLPM